MGVRGRFFSITKGIYNTMANRYNTTNSKQLERIADKLLSKGKRKKKTNKKKYVPKIQTEPQYNKQISEYYKSIEFIKYL